MPAALVLEPTEEAETTAELRLAPISNYPLIRVNLGKTQVDFVLDTGASIDPTHAVFIDANLAYALGYRKGRRDTNGNIWIVLPELSFGKPKATYRQVWASCQNLSDMSRACGGRPIAGLLPLSLFTGRQVDLDLPARRLHLRPAGSPMPAGARPLAIERRSDDASFYASLNVNGQTFPALLDTGTYDFEIPARFLDDQQVRLHDARPSLVGRGGIFPAQRGILPEIRLEPDVMIRDAEVAMIYAEPHGAIVARAKDPPQPPPAPPPFAVIGMSVLRDWRLIYDAMSVPPMMIIGSDPQGARPDPRAVQIEEELCRAWMKAER
jgi:hypothetical protein